MQRNPALDWLRGLLLVIMTIDHLPGAMRQFSFESLGFASAAEGFVFLSGFVAAMVYGRSPDPVRRREKILARVGKIYRYHTVLLLLILGLFSLLPSYAEAWAPWLQAFDTRPDGNLLLALGLLYQPQYLDILPMYCVFLALLPWMLSLLHTDRGGWLLLASAAFWALGQVFTHNEANLRALFDFPFELGFFNLLGWQFLFTLGAFFGFRYQRGIRLPYTPSSVLAALMLALFLFAVHHHLGDFGQIPVAAATERSRMAWLRLVNVLVLTYLIAGLTILLPRLFRSRWLESLGQNSLPIYAWHVLMVYLLTPVFREQVAEYGWGAELPLTLAALASLGIPIILLRHYERRDARLGSPG